MALSSPRAAGRGLRPRATVAAVAATALLLYILWSAYTAQSPSGVAGVPGEAPAPRLLVDHDEPGLTFLVIGDWGTGSASQRQVGALPTPQVAHFNPVSYAGGSHAVQVRRAVQPGRHHLHGRPGTRRAPTDCSAGCDLS
jgi:hypothetical protein